MQDVLSCALASAFSSTWTNFSMHAVGYVGTLATLSYRLWQKNVSRGDKNLLSLGVAIDLTEFNVCKLLHHLGQNTLISFVGK